MRVYNLGRGLEPAVQNLCLIFPRCCIDTIIFSLYMIRVAVRQHQIRGFYWLVKGPETSPTRNSWRAAATVFGTEKIKGHFVTEEVDLLPVNLAGSTGRVGWKDQTNRHTRLRIQNSNKPCLIIGMPDRALFFGVVNSSSLQVWRTSGVSIMPAEWREWQGWTKWAPRFFSI